MKSHTDIIRHVCGATTLLLTGAMSACGGVSSVEVVPAPEGTSCAGARQWGARGSASVAFFDGRAFMGVGVVSDMADKATARAKADTLAKAEVLTRVQAFFAELLASYEAGMVLATAPGPFEMTPEAAVGGVHIVDRCQVGTTHYALAMMDLQGLVNTLEADEDLDRRLRLYIRLAALEVHEGLVKGTKNVVR